ncbi:AMP-binding protein [Conexibacter sp. W3-3-2]|uniref:Acyl-CoA synthetase n=1 Tax=Paraconexibacter algicola TaxID=2133960 RepID=A0A2T4UFZ1_9ACTN|nr:AMP-binding protein [Conexibacter sp. W3-3-2]PTL58150.1 acyl-CoA synthetase [Paraconexibacter algicola]
MGGTSVELVPKVISRPAARIGAAAQNALEVARFGGLETDDEHAPFEVVAEQRVYRLRRYFPPQDERRLGSAPQDRPAIVLVPPMMLSAEVWDVSPQASAVRDLHAAGIDPWVVDFGAPEHEEGGLQRTLTDHVLAVSEACDRVGAATGRDVHLGGYSQGGMFCYQAAAYRRAEGLASLITFGSPVDTRGVLPFGLPEEVFNGAANVVAALLGRAALPAWASRTGFRLLDPAKSVRQRVEFVMALHDREALLPRESQRRFLAGEGFVAWSGPAIAELMRGFVAHNRMLQGGFVIDERLVTLADIACPCLCFVGEVDEIAPPPAVRAIQRAAPRAKVYEKSLRAGHFGLVVGSTAGRESWPAVAEWLQWCDGGKQGPPPTGIAPMIGGELTETGRGGGVGYQLELAADVGYGLAKSVLGGASRTVRSVREVAREAATQLPRLARLEQIAPGTRISLGLLLDEQAKRSPGSVCFLFEDRAHSHRDAKRRIDNVVRGLVSIGVRQGEHVGVLMETRPSALVTVAALSRLGAVGVLLRPDGNPTREAELGQTTKIIADPDNMHIALRAEGAHVYVLGGGGEDRDLGPDVTDMERIDPDAVELPAWYRPNPGKASDLAFVLFTGEGDRTRAARITNRRWALSAFGTASSASLGEGDTVYSVTPIHHPSGLLMSIGGAVAGGSRLAMAREFDPDTFWDEARRYGVTVAGYTWTLLRALVEAPPHPAEKHHGVRLFIGSGMPRGLWRRVLDRFAPARVIEFYAATEGDAILVNLTGAKPGALGRRLPGSAEVRVAAYDPSEGRLLEGPDGLARVCDDDEVGMLLSRLEPGVPTTGSPLRGVFQRGDAWLATGDLFRRDADGDHWLVDHVPALMKTDRGLVAATPIVDALYDLPAVDLAIAYGVRPREGQEELAVAAVTVRRGQTLTVAEIEDALGVLAIDQRPAIVHVVDEIPVTTWYRPTAGPLRAEGVPAANAAGRPKTVWYRESGRAGYKPLTIAARRKLVGVAPTKTPA